MCVEGALQQLQIGTTLVPKNDDLCLNNDNKNKNVALHDLSASPQVITSELSTEIVLSDGSGSRPRIQNRH